MKSFLGFQEEEGHKIALFILSLIIVPFLIFGTIIGILQYRVPRKYKPKWMSLAGTGVFGITSIYIFFFVDTGFWKEILFLSNGISGALVFLLYPPVEEFIRQRRIMKSGITIDLVRETTDRPKLKKGMLEDSNVVPIGISKINGRIVTIEKIRRLMHVLITGATGMGKTTLLKIFVAHSIKNETPAIIIDPKADENSITELEDLCITLGKHPRIIKKFDFANPRKSASYNPLKYGSAITVKDRIMASLTWSESYYQVIAGEFLTRALPAFEFLKIPFSLAEICSLLENDKQRNEVSKVLSEEIGKRHSAKEILEAFEGINSIKEKDLKGLAAQLMILNNREFGHLLSFDKAESEIDLRNAIENNEIIYFKLNVLANKDSAKRIGVMILEDIKAIANEIYNSEAKPKFCPIYIDEFTEFADERFIGFFTQCRGAGFALHLFTQGLENLDAVSREFRRILVGNALTKIIFRMDDSDGVNEIVSSVGTFDRMEESHQVSGQGIFKEKTGMGNLRETKQVHVAHDVIKNLNVGQAVIVGKSPATKDLIEVFQVGSLIL